MTPKAVVNGRGHSRSQHGSTSPQNVVPDRSSPPLSLIRIRGPRPHGGRRVIGDKRRPRLIAFTPELNLRGIFLCSCGLLASLHEPRRSSEFRRTSWEPVAHLTSIGLVMINTTSLAVLIPLLAMTTYASAGLAISYDALNRPVQVSGLPVPGFFDVDIAVDYSGKSFDDQFGSADPPPGTPGGLTWGDLTLAVNAASSLSSAMNVDSIGPVLAATRVDFPTSISSLGPLYVSGMLRADAGDDWRFGSSLASRGLARPTTGWATTTRAAVPEPDAFLFLIVTCLVMACRRVVVCKRIWNGCRAK